MRRARSHPGRHSLGTYIVTDRRSEGRQILNELLERKDAVALATVRLAALDAVEGQMAQAEQRLAKFLTQSPRDLTAQLLYADILLRGQKREEAGAAAKAAIAIDDSSAHAHLLAGEVAARSDRIEEAMAEFEKVLALDARPLDAALQLARLHLQLGHVDKALTYAQQALTIAPRSPDAQSLLVRVHLAQGDQAKAAAMVATLQTDYPNSPGLFNLLALIQLAKKTRPGARASYARALDLAPSNIEALSGVVRLDLAAGRRKEALERLDAAEKTAANNAASVDLLLTLGRGYGSAGDPAKAEAALKRAIDGDPGRLQGYSLLGSLYASQKRLDEAQQQFEDVIKRNPEVRSRADDGRDASRGATEAGVTRRKRTNRCLRWMLARPWPRITSPGSMWRAAASWRKRCNWRRWLPSNCATNPQRMTRWDGFREEGHGEPGDPFLETAAKADPTNPEFRYHLGTAYFKNSDWPKARRELEAGLKLQPTSPLAADARHARHHWRVGLEDIERSRTRRCGCCVCLLTITGCSPDRAQHPSGLQRTERAVRRNRGLLRGQARVPSSQRSAGDGPIAEEISRRDYERKSRGRSPLVVGERCSRPHPLHRAVEGPSRCASPERSDDKAGRERRLRIDTALP